MEIALRKRHLDLGLKKFLNNGEVEVAANHRAARANAFHLTGDPRYLDAISEGNRSLGQNDQTADEIAGDVLQTETDTYAHRARKNRERPEMDTRIIQDDQNPDD